MRNLRHLGLQRSRDFGEQRLRIEQHRAFLGRTSGGADDFREHAEGGQAEQAADLLARAQLVVEQLDQIDQQQAQHCRPDEGGSDGALRIRRGLHVGGDRRRHQPRVDSARIEPRLHRLGALGNGGIGLVRNVGLALELGQLRRILHVRENSALERAQLTRQLAGARRCRGGDAGGQRLVTRRIRCHLGALIGGHPRPFRRHAGAQLGQLGVDALDIGMAGAIHDAKARPLRGKLVILALLLIEQG